MGIKRNTRSEAIDVQRYKATSRTNTHTQTYEATNKRGRNMALLIHDFFDDPWQHYLASNRMCNAMQCQDGKKRKSSWPKVDVVEKENEYVVKADVPGIAKDKLKLEIQKDALVLNAEVEESKEEKEGNTIRRERQYHSFHRTIHLPSDVDHQAITANSEDGVLTVTLPKAAESLPKAIEIQ